MTKRTETWSCGTNSHLPFDVNVMLNLSINTVSRKKIIFTWCHSSHICVQNNESAAMFVHQKNPVGIVLFSHVKTYFHSKQFAKLLTTWLKTIYWGCSWLGLIELRELFLCFFYIYIYKLTDYKVLFYNMMHVFARRTMWYPANFSQFLLIWKKKV